MGKPKGRRWGSTSEIDYRTKVGSKAWKKKHPKRVQTLSAWRYLHLLKGSHKRVRASTKVRPSSNMPLKEMLQVAGAGGQRKRTAS